VSLLQLELAPRGAQEVAGEQHDRLPATVHAVHDVICDRQTCPGGENEMLWMLDYATLICWS